MDMEEVIPLKEGRPSSSDLQQQILKAFEQDDLKNFKSILDKSKTVSSFDLNFWYDAPNYGTLLDITLRTNKGDKYYSALITAGAENSTTDKNSETLLYAFESKNLDSFTKILSNYNSDPNISDNNGNFLIHLTAEMEDYKFLETLIKTSEIELNAVNERGQTALHIAARNKNEESCLALSKTEIDLDTLRDKDGKSGRDMVSLHLRHLENELGQSYLQYLCEKGFHELVNSYLKNGGDPNAIGKRDDEHPLMKAGYEGYSSIVQQLVRNERTKYTTDLKGRNVLHYVLDGAQYKNLGNLENKNENRDYYECLKLLLKVPRSKLNINCQDKDGNTPLHCTGDFDLPKAISLLLNSGANVTLKNNDNELALASISPKIFEHYLDSCLRKGFPPAKEEHFISFGYSFLTPPIKQISTSWSSALVELEMESSNDGSSESYITEKNTSEMDLLLFITNASQFRPLLKHPIISSLIFLRWQKIKWIFWLNLTFYVLFCVFLFAYILGTQTIKTNPTENDAHNNKSTEKSSSFENPNWENSNLKLLLWYLCVVMFFMLISREAIQFLVSPSNYMRNLDNWLEVSIIFCTSLVLFGNKSIIQTTSPIAILLSCADLVLLIGRHPAMSTNIEMFKRVSWEFLQFLFFYAILILGFALSFFLLFNDNKGDTFFSNPWVSLFKIVIMITGELDSSSLKFNDIPVISHLVFLSFVFLIAIVLFNLLVGIAVSDIQAIKSDAKILSYASQVNLLSNFDPMFYVMIFLCFVPRVFYLICGSSKFICYRRKNRLYSVLKYPYNFVVFPNMKNIVAFINIKVDGELEDGYDNVTDFRDNKCYMDASILDAAREIIGRREENNYTN